MENDWSLPPKRVVKVNVFGIFSENPLPNGNRGCLYVRKHKVILETEHVEAVAEWEIWSSFIDPRYSDVIRSLVKRMTDKRLKLHVSVVNESKNQLARFLAKDGALNRTLPVIMARPFGRVKEILHRDMGLGTTEMGFDLVTEDQYRKIKEGDSEEGVCIKKSS
ncbi:hypothetical protein AgCh_007597 [Apium graveolens]